MPMPTPMHHFAIETDHVLFAEKVMYIIQAPDETTAQQMIGILIGKDSGRYISNTDTLNNVAGIKCVYVEVEYTNTEDEFINYGNTSRKRKSQHRLRSGSRRTSRTKRVPVWK